MPPTCIDLRSDTLTKPSAEMRAAMAAAEVGDDVFCEDPTVNRLQEYVANLLGTEAALFVPSGTMGNQLGVRVHCEPGDEFICETNCHIYNFEQGAYAQFFGLVAKPILAEFGRWHPQQLVNHIRPNDIHQVRTRLICMENTHNRGGGRILDYDETAQMCAWAAENGLARHLDGARLFNAVVASGISAADWAKHFDTVSICFSKGLGAPIGSALCGPEVLIEKARRLRKPLGGGLRQAGILAAGALYALEHNVERLADDHAKAKLLANAIHETPGLELVPDIVETNIVIFRIEPTLGTAEDFCQKLKNQHLLLYPIANDQVRIVTHLDVTMENAERAAGLIADCAGGSC